MQSRTLIARLIVLVFMMVVAFSPAAVNAAEELRGFDLQTMHLVSKCRDEVVKRFEHLLNSGTLTVGQLFDTFYIPIPDTYPQKYHTQYDTIVDQNLQTLLDGYLNRNRRFVFFVITDRNGYLPTHNSKFSQPLTGDKEVDAKKNRTKLIFNDRTGLAAARNTAQYLLQSYSRDTGEMMTDLSVPVFIRGKHWGCVRVGYK